MNRGEIAEKCGRTWREKKKEEKKGEWLPAKVAFNIFEKLLFDDRISGVGLYTGSGFNLL